MRAQTLFQDAREVHTKRRKTFASIFFPVGPEPLQFVGDYVAMLKHDFGFSDDDPLFPSTQIGCGEDRAFIAQGLSRNPWSGAGPIRRVFWDAFSRAGLPYAKPHSFQDTIARLGQRLLRDEIERPPPLSFCNYLHELSSNLGRDGSFINSGAAATFPRKEASERSLRERIYPVCNDSDKPQSRALP
jgi:hypothetical protein